MQFIPSTVLLSLLLFVSPSWAINCKLAATPTETAICSDKNLQTLDSKLTRQYRQLSAASPQRALVQSQKTWLAQRDSCAADARCIGDAYTARIAELSQQLDRVNAYQPDATDTAALEQLRTAIAQAALTEAESPVEKAMATFTMKDKSTTFTNIASEEKNAQGAVFPNKRPAGVSTQEWALLSKNPIEAESEYGRTTYTLVDLDGDGLRDLVIDAYIGGTGLFNDISTARQTATKFVATASGLYSLNGRGGNQEAQWVTLQGRTYAVYRDSFYGQDQLFLLRPFENNTNALSLVVRYSYRLMVPKNQTDANSTPPKVSTLDNTTFKALNLALQSVSKTPSLATSSDKPVCPVPSGASEDERNSYMGFGPGHYSFEIVADFPVWIDKLCHVAQLINWFGSYKPRTGLFANLQMRRAHGAGQELSYSVEGLRRFVDVKLGKVQFDK
jgi:uncharacterized protein